MSEALYHAIDVYGITTAQPTRIKVVTLPDVLTEDFILSNLLATGCADRWVDRVSRFALPNLRIRAAFDLMVVEVFVASAAITGDADSVINNGYRLLPPLNGSQGIHIVDYGSVSFLGRVDHTITAKSVDFHTLLPTDLNPKDRENYFFF